MPKKSATQLNREVAEVLAHSSSCPSYSTKDAKKIIKAMYGTLDPNEIYLEAASRRTNTPHEEHVSRGDVTSCRLCGVVESPTADPAFHPEQYI